MKKFPNLTLAVLLAVGVALGVAEGVRLRQLRESEMFYRWIIAEATQFRVFSDLSAVEESEEGRTMKDVDLFRRIIAKTEPELAAEPVQVDSKGTPVKKILSLAADESRADVMWKFATGGLLAPERHDFLRYLRDKELTNVESQFDPNSVYSGEGAGVSLSNIFFGFRKLAANFVWLQVDRYWHQGMMQRMIPLMKTCVMLDPTFVDAYLLGAWHLAYNATAKMPDTPEPLKKWSEKYHARIGEKESYYYLGIDFLKDGINKNPYNYKLYFDLGYGIYNLKLKDYTNAVKYLELAVQQRHNVWVPRMLYIAYESNGQYKQALAGWEDYLEKHKINPTDSEEDKAHKEIEREKALRFIARNKGLLKEREADQVAERAKTAPTPAEAQADRAQADKLRDEARRIYESIDGGAGKEEPFALGRIMRMKAMKLIEDGQYLQAIAILDQARWKSNDFFNEASDMIIDAKIKGGLPLSTSEKKAVIRREEEKKYKQERASSPA